MRTRSEILRKWVRATTIGWLMGLALVIALAIAWDAIAGTAQFMVGLGMGVGVGFLQSRVLNEWLPAPRRWLWATVAGMGIPFVLWDISTILGSHFLSQTSCVLIGSLLVSSAQIQLLPFRSPKVFLWIPACVLGWGSPVALMEAGNSGLLPGPWSIVSVLTIFFGGLILGAVTGLALPWVLQAEPVGR